MNELLMEQTAEAALAEIDACRTGAGIYRKLRTEGAYGLKASDCLCPLAVWFSRRTHLDVQVTRVNVYFYGPGNSGGKLCVRLSPHMRRFVAMVDRGSLPGIEAGWESPIRYTPRRSRFLLNLRNLREWNG